MEYSPLLFSADKWIQAHWYKRFSEEPKNPVVILACSQVAKTQPEECFIDILNITREPIFDNKNNLIGQWINQGAKPRPNNKRFFERFNNNTKKFNTWTSKYDITTI